MRISNRYYQSLIAYLTETTFNLFRGVNLAGSVVYFKKRDLFYFFILSNLKTRPPVNKL
jgi:hypothetical protein